MSQLRDSVTSELIFEGTPTECALMAQEVGLDKVVFDGVSEAFDVDAVVEAHSEIVTNLNNILDDPNTDDKDKPGIEANIAKTEAVQPDAEQVREVQAIIDEARSRVEEE